MPRIFAQKPFESYSPKAQTYADKHSPVILCAPEAERGKPFPVTVRIGNQAKHPNTQEHHFCYIQLWDLETLIAELRFDHRCFGVEPLQIEAHFTIIPQHSLRLTAMAYCNKHGLWQSEEFFISAPEHNLADERKNA
jgi:Desulfoferrodoxin